MAEQLVHKGAGQYGQTHDWDCPACVAANEANKARHQETNPHRKGTKVWAAREAMDRGCEAACDPRTERYWTM